MARIPAQGQGNRRGRPWYTWLASGTFVLGILVGVLLLGLLSATPPALSAEQEESASDGDASSVPPGATAEIRVNEACLRAINAARDIASAVEDLGTAAAALDTAQLDEAIRRMQPLQDRLQENSSTCETTGTAPGEDVPDPTGSPATPSPTG